MMMILMDGAIENTKLRKRKNIFKYRIISQKIIIFKINKIKIKIYYLY